MKGDVDICAASWPVRDLHKNPRQKMMLQGIWEVIEQNAGNRRDTQNKMAEWVALIEKVVTCD